MWKGNQATPILRLPTTCLSCTSNQDAVLRIETWWSTTLRVMEARLLDRSVLSNWLEIRDFAIRVFESKYFKWICHLDNYNLSWISITMTLVIDHIDLLVGYECLEYCKKGRTRFWKVDHICNKQCYYICLINIMKISILVQVLHIFNVCNSYFYSRGENLSKLSY